MYPGHGMRYIRRDGQPVTLGGSKTKSLMLQKMKPSKLQWTQGWRRLNKKMNVEATAKKRCVMCGRGGRVLDINPFRVSLAGSAVVFWPVASCEPLTLVH